MRNNEEVFPNLDPGMTNKYFERLFFPNIKEILIYIMTVIGDTFLTLVAFSLSTVALFGYCLYIAYFKSNKDNEIRLLNCLTSVLAINYISTTITSVATIVYYNQGIKYNDDRFGDFWKIMRIYSGVNTSLVFGELTLASILNLNFPSTYLVISLMWKVSWTMVLNFLIAFLWHLVTIASCGGKWTSTCVMETFLRDRIFLFVPIIFAQSVIMVDCLWGWRRLMRKFLKPANNVVHPFPSNGELDRAGISTGFISLVLDTSVRVINNIITRAGYIDETIVLRYDNNGWHFNQYQFTIRVKARCDTLVDGINIIVLDPEKRGIGQICRRYEHISQIETEELVLSHCS